MKDDNDFDKIEVDNDVDEMKDSGTDDPKGVFPLCYSGKASVIGLTESVLVTVNSMGKVGNKVAGTINIDADGISPEHCKALNYTKVSGTDQAISFDKPNPRCLGGASFKAAYCSDQDAVQLHVVIAHLPVPSVPVTLHPTKCQ